MRFQKYLKAIFHFYIISFYLYFSLGPLSPLIKFEKNNKKKKKQKKKTSFAEADARAWGVSFKYMYTENFTTKNEDFRIKIPIFFYISAQNIDCGTR